MANSEPLHVSIIGMPGSGKTVLVTTMAMRMVEMMETGVCMTPAGAERHRTHKYVLHNWLMLNDGQWPESTPIGEQVNLQWELKTQKNTASIRFSDCAGQDIHTIFSDDNFDPDNISEDVKPVYNLLVQSDIVLVLINMEDLIGRDAKQTAQNGADLDLMISTLLNDPERERKIALVINQYDRYKAEVDNLFNGDLNKYLRQRLPLLYAQHMRQKNMSIIPVAAVAETSMVEQNGIISLVPAPDFKSYNLESLISWLTDAVDELTPKKEIAVQKAIEEEEIKQRQENEGKVKSCVFYAGILLVILVCVFGWLFRSVPKEEVPKANKPVESPSAEAPSAEAPAPDFKSYNLESLITWLTDAVDELAPKEEIAVQKAIEEEEIAVQKAIEEEEIKRQQEDEAVFKSCFFYSGILFVILVCVFVWLFRSVPKEEVPKPINR